MAQIYAKGTFSPTVYFENASGHIILPGNAEDCNQRGKAGYIRKEANTLPLIDDLQRRLESQERSEMEMRLDHDYQIFQEKRQKVRDNLLRSMTSDTTKPYEKDFIKNYLSISDARKRKFYHQHQGLNAYFMGREYDDGGTKTLQD